MLTFDGTQLGRLWIGEYCPELHAAESRRYPPLAEILEALGGEGEIDEVPIPFDCLDGFTEAFYGRPEEFLDPGVRACQSAWGFVEQAAVVRAMDLLESDLRSGRWDERFGHLRGQDEFVGALRLITANPAQP